MATMKTIINLCAISLVLKLAMAANYTVGGPNGGWDTISNLQTWATSQTFSVGDNLIFKNGPMHNVFEVSKEDYESCQTSNPIQAHTDTTTLIPLSAPGLRYFICGSPGHCTQGMKLQINVNVLASASILPPTASPLPLPSSPSTDSPISSASPSPAQPQLFPSSFSLNSPLPSVSLPPPLPSSSAGSDFLQANVKIGFRLLFIILLGI